jgi:hypothetical protein
MEGLLFFCEPTRELLQRAPGPPPAAHQRRLVRESSFLRLAIAAILINKVLISSTKPLKGYRNATKQSATERAHQRNHN